MIYILTGEIRTGKTTALLDWCKNRNDVDGLLCPDGENGKRYFLKIHSEIKFEFEANSETLKDKIIQIGNFKFLKSAFEEANRFLALMLYVPTNFFLVIDEIGKLELKNLGLHNATELLIPKFINKEKQHLILVVREPLLEEVISHYQINTHTLITIDDLAKNSFA